MAWILSHAALTLTKRVTGAGRLSGTQSHAMLGPAISHTTLADSRAHHGTPIYYSIYPLTVRSFAMHAKPLAVSVRQELDTQCCALQLSQG